MCCDQILCEVLKLPGRVGHAPAKTHHDCGSRCHVGSVAPPRAKRKNQGGQIVLAGVEQCLVNNLLSCLFRAETEVHD